MVQVLYPGVALLRITFTGSQFGEECQMVQHFLTKTSVVNEDQLIAELTNNFLTEFRSTWHNATRFFQIGHQRIEQGQDYPQHNRVISPVIGAQGGEGMPHQIAQLWVLKTGLTGHQGNGRCYMPGMPQSAFVGGNLSNNWLNVLSNVRVRVKNLYSNTGNSALLSWVVAPRAAIPGTAFGMQDLLYRTYPVVMRSRRPNIA